MPTTADQARAIQQAVRWGLLQEEYGGEDDARIRDWFIQQAGDEMAEHLGTPDISGNLLVCVAAMLTTPGLYGLGAPVVRHVEADGAAVAKALEDAGYWSRMQFIEYLAAGMGDAIVALEADPVDGLSVRTVPPQDVYFVTAPHDPGQLIELGELRLRDVPGLGLYYCWDRYRLPSGSRTEPDFAVLAETEQGQVNVTAAVGAPLDYLWRYAGGKPFIPYVRYSRLDTGGAWHSTSKRGLTRAALNSITFWTFTGRCALDASFGTDIFAGLEPPGGSMVQTPDGAGRTPSRVVRRMPGSMLFLQASQGDQPFHAAIGAGANLSVMLNFCLEYAKNALRREGIGGEDYSSGPNPQSGESMALTQAAQRRVAARVRPLFRRRDLEALGMAAALLRTAGLPTGPERGYAIEYLELPLSTDEVAAEKEHWTWLREQRLVSRVDLYLHVHPDTDREIAIAELRRIDADEAALGAPDPATQTQSTTEGP